MPIIFYKKVTLCLLLRVSYYIGQNKKRGVIMKKIIIEKIFQVAITAFAALLIDCSSTAYRVMEGEITQLSKSASYAITVPNDYPDESKSGITTSLELQKVLAGCGVNASLLNRFPDYKSVNAETKEKYDYIVEPTITYWEDNIATWSGKPDKLLLVITIYNAKTSEVMDTFTIDAESSSIVFGDNDPVDLIKEPASVHYGKIIK